MKVLEAIQRSAEFLAGKGVDSPRLQVELMLGQVLSLPRLKLYLDFERLLTAEQMDALRGMVVRRGKREPLQHILGSVSFCGFEMKSTRAALIPRPETELLAERAWEHLNRLPGSPRGLDFGAGTGCLAIAISLKAPRSEMEALDVSPAALELAKANAERHQAKVRFHLGDGFAALPQGSVFDLIVSNPPYIPAAEIEALEPEVRQHDPRLALDGGADGLDFYRRLAREGKRHLRPGGTMMLEFGDGQAGPIQELFQQQGWQPEAAQADYTGRLRILIARNLES